MHSSSLPRWKTLRPQAFVSYPRGTTAATVEERRPGAFVRSGDSRERGRPCGFRLHRLSLSSGLWAFLNEQGFLPKCTGGKGGFEVSPPSFSFGGYLTLVIGKCGSEFDIQADLYFDLKAQGFDVKGEARCTHDGKRIRLDLLVSREKKPIFAVEVKPARSKRWRVEWMKGRQFKAYRALPIPVYMVCGPMQGKLFAQNVPEVRAEPGVHWVEDWWRVPA